MSSSNAKSVALSAVRVHTPLEAIQLQQEGLTNKEMVIYLQYLGCRPLPIAFKKKQQTEGTLWQKLTGNERVGRQTMGLSFANVQETGNKNSSSYCALAL
jgi:hypothetical protein